MKKMTLALTAAISLGSVAQAAPGDLNDSILSSAMTLAPFVYTSYSTNTALDKAVVEAQDDITYFVATDGQHRTAQLEAALNWTKQNFNTANASDLEIAQELLTSLNQK